MHSTARLTKGQPVAYHFIAAGGQDTSQHLWLWAPGYEVVEPISPFAPGCALIVKKNGQLQVAFNARFADIRILS